VNILLARKYTWAAAGIETLGMPPGHAADSARRPWAITVRTLVGCLNVLGRYSFTLSTPRQGLRPLRDPDAPELDEDDDALD
jgi:hypothetical protein